MNGFIRSIIVLFIRSQSLSKQIVY